MKKFNKNLPGLLVLRTNQNLSIKMHEIEKKTISLDGLLNVDSPSSIDSVILCVTLIAKEIPQRRKRKRE